MNMNMLNGLNIYVSSLDIIQFIYWTFKKFEQELAAKTLCFSFSHNDYGTIPTFVHY